MILFIIFGIFAKEFNNNYNEAFVFPYNVDQKNTEANIYIIVSSKDDNAHFALITKTGELLTFDKETKKLKFIKVDIKYFTESMCTINNDTSSEKCKDVKKAEEGEEGKDEGESEGEEEKKSEEDILNLFLRFNNAHSSSIGIKGTNFCIFDDKGEFIAKECPRPGYGGDNFGIILIIKPNENTQEEQENGQHNSNKFEQIKNLLLEEGRNLQVKTNNPQGNYRKKMMQSDIVEENPQKTSTSVGTQHGEQNPIPGRETSRGSFNRRYIDLLEAENLPPNDPSNELTREELQFLMKKTLFEKEAAHLREAHETPEELGVGTQSFVNPQAVGENVNYPSKAVGSKQQLFGPFSHRQQIKKFIGI
ncbi:putative SP-containing protein [Vairimorpha necatrix]|uniref:SP-containing protein n=1 Tax=Vairimorpha necatrix TaxID=6039 RepID=A0AAX4JF56_9MICR